MMDYTNACDRSFIRSLLKPRLIFPRILYASYATLDDIYPFTNASDKSKFE